MYLTLVFFFTWTPEQVLVQLGVVDAILAAMRENADSVTVQVLFIYKEVPWSYRND